MRRSWVLARRLFLERRVLVGGVAVGASLTLILQIAMFPSIRDSFEGLSEDLPEAFTSLLGSADFTSPEGFLQAEAYGSMGPILVILVAISMVASGIPGAEASGRMMLLATSTASRREVALGAAMSAAGGVTSVVGVYWIATVAGSAWGELQIGVGRLSAAAFSLWLLGLAVAAVAFAGAGMTGSRSVTIGVASTVAVGSFLAYGLLPLSARLAWGRHVSLWFPYLDHDPLQHGVSVVNAAWLLAVTVAGLGLGVAGFERRDLR